MTIRLFDVLNRTALGGVVIFLGLSVFDRSVSMASIGKPETVRTRISELKIPKRGPAPSMIGSPISFDGPGGGHYPPEAWRTYMNGMLAKLGYEPIDGCRERTRGESFAYIEDCDGEMVFVSSIYRASASMMKPKTSSIDVRTGSGLPKRDVVSVSANDIVDRSAYQRNGTQTAMSSARVSRLDESPPAAPMIPSSASAYVDESVPAVLRSPVPQTRRRPPRTAAAD